MELEALKRLLENSIESASVEVSSEGSHVNLLIVSDVFEGLRAVKQQQLVYGLINDKIADGSLHAVNMQLFTQAEWSAKQA